MTSSGSPFPSAEGLCHGSAQASGLPARILAVLRTSGILTLGDLCGATPSGAKLDGDDRALLARVSSYCCTVRGGHPARLSLLEWLDLFLTPRLADVVRLHYGLQDSSAALALHEAKLRQTGFKLGVSRERTRQLLGLALDSLRQALPLYAAEPLFRAALAALRSAGGALAADALARRTDPEWGGASPLGAFLLLANSCPDASPCTAGSSANFPPRSSSAPKKACATA